MKTNCVWTYLPTMASFMVNCIHCIVAPISKTEMVDLDNGGNDVYQFCGLFLMTTADMSIVLLLCFFHVYLRVNEFKLNSNIRRAAERIGHKGL